MSHWNWDSTWPAPAKLNLFLHVVGRRADGYHLLQTVFRFIDRADTLRFAPRKDDAIVLATPTSPSAPPACCNRPRTAATRARPSISPNGCRWVAGSAAVLPMPPPC